MFCGVWIRGTKSQYFPGSNFPRAKPFRTKRQAQKGRNCCSPDSVIIFLELIESTYSLLKTCSACIFKKNWYSFENVQKILKQTGTILKIMKPSGLKVWDHREISQQFYHMKSYGNIRVALRLWQMFWFLKVSGNVQKPTGKDEVILKYWDVWKICKPSRNISFETQSGT